MKNNFSKITSDIQVLEDHLLDPHEVSKKLELKDRSRRNNVCFDGLTEDPNEIWDDCEKYRTSFLIIYIEGNIEIYKGHRFGKLKGSHPFTIVCIFLRFKDKQNIFQNAKKLKDIKIFVYKDFCSDTMELPKSLWEKVLECRRQGTYVYLNYKAIVVRDKS